MKNTARLIPTRDGTLKELHGVAGAVHGYGAHGEHWHDDCESRKHGGTVEHQSLYEC